MDSTFLQTLEELHDTNEYQEIIDIIEALPKEAQDTEIIGHLARAYCNLAQYDYALTLLFSIEQPNDFLWNFRVGYAYYYKRQPLHALSYFKQAFALHPSSDVADYIALCQVASTQNKSLACIQATKSTPRVINPLPAKKLENKQEKPPVIRYLPDDLSAVKAHIEQYFGEIVDILPSSSDRAFDIRLCICPPNEKNDYYTISTLGMGALPMNIPEEHRTRIPARLELIMTLPSDWEFDFSNDRCLWPLHWLLVTAYLPFDKNTWIDYGHSLSTSIDHTPFDASTKQSCILTIKLQDRPEGASMCTLPDGETVRFLQLLPLYPEELEYKTQYGATALLRHMSNTGHIVCPYRLNTCTPDLLSARVNPSPYLC